MYVCMCVYIYIHIHIHYTHTYTYAYTHIVKAFLNPFPLRLLDILLLCRWRDFGAVNPFNIISQLACGNYSASFSTGIAHCAGRGRDYATSPIRPALGYATCVQSPHHPWNRNPLP